MDLCDTPSCPAPAVFRVVWEEEHVRKVCAKDLAPLIAGVFFLYPSAVTTVEVSRV